MRSGKKQVKGRRAENRRVWQVCGKIAVGMMTVAVLAVSGVPAVGLSEEKSAETGSGYGILCAWAAENRTKITDISLTVHSTIAAGSSSGHVSVSANGGNYRVGSVEILNDDDDWKGGMTPRVSFELYADSGYYFSGSSKSMFSFSGDDASYVTARREDNSETLVVTIKLDKLDNGDLSVTGAYWDEGSATANWDENSSAKYYQVKLYRDGSAVGSTRTTSETEYDFAGSFTRKGDYYFEVRAVGSGSEKGDWESSDTMYVTSREADDLSDDYDSDGPGGSSHSSGGPGVTGGGSYGPGGAGSGSYNPGPGGYGSGSSGGPGVTGGQSGVASTGGNHWCLDQHGWWYQYSGGGYPRDGFQLIDGKWYFFNSTGYMCTGWIQWQSKWYYCDASGALWMNARTPDGYYVGGDGARIS